MNSIKIIKDEVELFANFPDFSKMVRSTAGPPPSPFSPADWLAGSAATQRDSEGW